MIDCHTLEHRLAGQAFGHTAYYYARCPTTQDLAHTLARTHPAGTLVLAEEQTAGRGRRGRHWHDQRGASLTASFLLTPPLWVQPEASTPLLAGMAVLQALEQQVPGLGGCLWLKWPNDVVYQSADDVLHKLAGILLEARHAPGQASHAVLGIGINANHSPEALPAVSAGSLAPTSLYALTRRKCSRQALLVALCEALTHYLGHGAAAARAARVWEPRLIVPAQDSTAGPGPPGPPVRSRTARCDPTRALL